MRNIIVFICSWLACVTLVAQKPTWVTIHPISEKEYIGVGMASLSEADYMKKATQYALSDIASQISIKLETNSFLHTVDVDGKSREMFEDKIQTSMTAWMEGQELKETFQSDDSFYVYYVLDKKKYAKNSETRRKQAIQTGLDYLQKGQDAEASMNLALAVQLYAKGLEAVEPWVFMDLMSDGMNVPVELYHAYVNVFSNMAITTNVIQVEGEAFKAIPSPIAGCLSKDGNVIPNVKLKAYFVTGEGVLSESMETDHTGTSEFYVMNITSKDKVQELRICIDDSFINALPKSYHQLLQNQVWPSAKVTIALKSAPLTAYLHVNDEHDLEGLEQRIGSLLTNNHFTMTDASDDPQIFLDMSTKLEMGSVVSGGIYDLNTCYCTLVLKIYDNKTEQLKLNYTVNQLKVLVPVHKTVEETMMMCVREMMKRVNRELPNRLKKLNLN
jgi:hypothetical protein